MHSRHNKDHVKGKGHLHLVALQRRLLSEAQAIVSEQHHANDGDSFPWGDADGPSDDDCNGGNEPRTNTNNKGDCWLTSAPGKLGDPALSLAAILRGSFPPDSKSPAFYESESKNPGQGAKYLTAIPFELKSTDVSTEEAVFHLKMAKFVTALSKTEQEDLAYCLLSVYNARVRDDEINIFVHTRPPLTTTDFTDFYGDSKKSIITNLPNPVIRKTVDQNHSYVTLTDVIQNMLADSTAVDQFQFETDVVTRGDDSACFDDAEPATVSQTRAAYSLFLDLKKNEDEGSGFVLFLWVKRWCDDFDPNNTKQSRNQVWLMTNTICAPPGENTGRNTFFMAIGQKGDDHQEIDKLFEEELEVLTKHGKTFYHGGRKELIRVKAGTVCVCVDRPERAALYQVGDHGGTFSCFWGHAVAVDGKCEDNCLPNCPFCRQRQLNNHLDAGSAMHLPDSPPPECEDAQCAAWNYLDTRFTSRVPNKYPTDYDQRVGTPEPPIGRDDFDEDARLPCIYLTVEWLRKATIFAHHQMKTKPPHPSRKQKFWTKENLKAFLRTCGITGKLVNDIYDSAQRNDDTPPLPYTWKNLKAIQLNHYAAMHTLFLGHAKSNYDMVSNVLSHFSLATAYGKQANKYLRDIQALRCNRFFDAQPLSTSTWGTGVWVSENYLFWVRALNFFCTLPALHDNLHTGKDNFEPAKRMVLRFCSASLVAISRIMSEKKTVGDMDAVVRIYLDTMVEMDRWLQETVVDTTAESDVLNGTGAPASGTVAQTGKKRKKKSKDTYNFCKSISLGILSAAEAHRFHGPAYLHWEGGWPGERKIQPAKPIIQRTKRATSDWQVITLRRLWQDNALSGLIEKADPETAAKVRQSRALEGHVRIYRNVSDVLEAIHRRKPMSGVLDNDGSVWVAYRPTVPEFNNDTTKTTQQPWTRSAVQLLKLDFDDSEEAGQLVSHLCWFAPFSVAPNVKMTLGSLLELKTCVDQYVLLLPKLGKDGEYENIFYVIGSKWTERVKGGTFAQLKLSPDLFKDWQPEER